MENNRKLRELKLSLANILNIYKYIIWEVLLANAH